MSLPTPTQTVERLKKNLDDRKSVRIKWKLLYAVAGRSTLRDSFLEQLRDAALERGIIVGYGNRYVVLAKD